MKAIRAFLGRIRKTGVRRPGLVSTVAMGRARDFEAWDVGDDTYIFEGKTKLVDFCRIIDLDDDFFDDSLDADTLAGLMLELKGDFPKIHEKFTYNDLSFEILKKEQRRISRVKVVINNAKKK